MVGARPTWNEYVPWARSALGARFDRLDELFHKANVQAIRATAENQQFFRELGVILADAARDYNAERPAARLFAQSKLELATKSFESAVEKSYRMNVLRNKNFPDPPTGGWIVPGSWYSQINDMVRGTLVCSYMDSLAWLAERLRVEADKRGLRLEFNSEVRDEGYYAFHLYVKIPSIELETREGDGPVKSAFTVPVEIQLTTQLQNSLRDVTHFFYEQRRLAGLRPDWKWRHGDPQFRASYMSHTLHLVDALIVELRDHVSAARETAHASNATDITSTDNSRE